MATRFSPARTNPPAPFARWLGLRETAAARHARAVETVWSRLKASRDADARFERGGGVAGIPADFTCDDLRLAIVLATVAPSAGIRASVERAGYRLVTIRPGVLPGWARRALWTVALAMADARRLAHHSDCGFRPKR